MPGPDRPSPAASRGRSARRPGRALLLCFALALGGCSSLAWLRLPWSLTHAGHGLLAWFVPLAVLSVLLARGLQQWLRGPKVSGAGPQPLLTTYEAAFLAGGEARVVEVACASLAQRGWLITTQDWQALKPTKICGTPEDPLERAVLAAIARDGRPAHLRRVAALRIAPALYRRLHGLGLLHDARTLQRLRRWPALLTGTVLLAGLAGIGFGLLHQQPVVPLVIAVASLAVTTLIFAAGHPQLLTRAGEALLAALRERHAPDPGWQRSDPALLLCLALCGAAAVRGLVPGGVGHVLAPPASDDDAPVGLDAGLDPGGSGCDSGGDGGCGSGCSG